VAIVNGTFVRHYLREGSPLGRILTIYPGTPRAQAMEIVGVVRDAAYSSPREPAPATWYMPIDQGPPLPFATVRLTVRVRTGSAANVSRDVAAVVAAVDPRMTVTVRALDEQLRSALTRDRLMAQLAGFFGGLALLLSGLGLYGVTAYAVSLRRTDFGVRMALGAAPWQIAVATLMRVARVTSLGVVAGAALSWWGAHVVGVLLYGITPRDPVTVTAAAGGLVLISMLAAWIRPGALPVWTRRRSCDEISAGRRQWLAIFS